MEADLLEPRGECILVLPYPDTKNELFLNNEMRLLVKSSNYRILEEVHLRINNPKYLFSPSRMIDLKSKIEERVDALVIVGVHLSAKQHINLEKKLECMIIDKFELVLEIFALRAMTEEAKIQIQLAQLKYESPRQRLRLMNRLSIEGAWHTERAGFRGTGENPLHEFDAGAKKREAHLKSKLSKLKQKRIERRLNRKRFHHDSVYVSIVGYTSAGKSTILNALTNTNAASVSSRLFETLDTRIRSFKIADLKIFVTDTVGFIEDLPTFLIDSFRSTLEESLAADIILIVIDGSESSLDLIIQKLNVTLNTVNEIIPQNNRVLVINKIDLISTDQLETRIKLLNEHFPEYEVVSISAEQDVLPLIRTIENFRPPKRYLLKYAPNYNFRSFCHEFASVEEESFGDQWLMIFSIRKPTYGLEFIKRKAEALNVTLNISEV
ncbi:MAG: GTPase HflX [Candidatus Hodarchaeales archaeon]|jgi:GTP-binding protein HflX